MKIRYSIILFVLSLALFSGCKVNELPLETTGEILFQVRGDFGEDTLLMEAGLKDVFMHSGFEEEPDLPIIFHGRLSNANCQDCGEFLEVRFRDIRLRNEAIAVDMDSVMDPGSRLFYVGDGTEAQKVARVFFENDTVLENSSYQWNFGDGATFQGKNPVHDYKDSLLTQVNVCLESVDPSGCTTSICNEINLQDTSCQIDFAHLLYANSTYVEFLSEVQGKPPYRYSWSFGDGWAATLANPGYYFGIPQVYEVCLTVEDANNCIRTLCKNITVDPTICESNFSYRVTNTSVPDLEQFRRIEIWYQNADGEFFSSSFQSQPGSSFFQILSHEPYERDRNGNLTEQVAIRFDCNLWNEEGESIRIQNGEGQIAVAYP